MDRVEQEPLVRLRGLGAEDLAVAKVEADRQELQVRPGHLRGHRQRDALVRLDADHELVGIDTASRVAVEDHVRGAVEADRDLAHALRHPLAGAQIEGHTGPAPVVDREP